MDALKTKADATKTRIADITAQLKALETQIGGIGSPKYKKAIADIKLRYRLSRGAQTDFEDYHEDIRFAKRDHLTNKQQTELNRLEWDKTKLERELDTAKRSLANVEKQWRQALYE